MQTKGISTKCLWISIHFISTHMMTRPLGRGEGDDIWFRLKFNDNKVSPIQLIFSFGYFGYKKDFYWKKVLHIFCYLFKSFEICLSEVKYSMNWSLHYLMNIHWVLTLSWYSIEKIFVLNFFDYSWKNLKKISETFFGKFVSLYLSIVSTGARLQELRNSLKLNPKELKKNIWLKANNWREL